MRSGYACQRNRPCRYNPRRMSALWALTAFAMTLAGGAFAWRYQRYLHAPPLPVHGRGDGSRLGWHLWVTLRARP